MTLKLKPYVAIFIAVNMIVFAAYDVVNYSWVALKYQPECVTIHDACIPSLLAYEVAAYAIIFYVLVAAYLLIKSLRIREDVSAATSNTGVVK